MTRLVERPNLEREVRAALPRSPRPGLEVVAIHDLDNRLDRLVRGGRPV